MICHILVNKQYIRICFEWPNDVNKFNFCRNHLQSRVHGHKKFFQLIISLCFYLLNPLYWWSLQTRSVHRDLLRFTLSIFTNDRRHHASRRIITKLGTSTSHSFAATTPEGWHQKERGNQRLYHHFAITFQEIRQRHLFPQFCFQQ